MLRLELTVVWIYLMLGHTKGRNISRRLLGAKHKNLRFLTLYHYVKRLHKDESLLKCI